MFHVPEKYRIKNHPVASLNTDARCGNNGCFIIPVRFEVYAIIIASDGRGWEHVSVHIDDRKKNIERTPSWAEMCFVKDLFWDDEDCVIQYHPPRSMYVNNHEHTLHLWRPTGINIPVPETILVGLIDNNIQPAAATKINAG